MTDSTTRRIVTGGFFADCPDCGGSRYLTTYVNGRGETLEAWACACPEEEAILCTVDLVLDGNEEHEAREDHTGRAALYIIQFDEYEEDDDA